MQNPGKRIETGWKSRKNAFYTKIGWKFENRASSCA